MKSFALVLVAICSSAACGGSKTFKATMTAGEEVPSNGSGGNGTVTATLDGTTLSVGGTYANLTGAATAAHVHSGAKGVAGPVVCPLTVSESGTAGSGALSGNCTSLSANDLDSGNLYVNVHTATYPEGEIRGQLVKK